MPHNHSKRRSFTPVATSKDAISGDRQGTTQPLLPSANIFDSSLELDPARIQRHPSPLAGSSTTISARKWHLSQSIILSSRITTFTARPTETPLIHSNGAPRSQCKHHCVRADCPVQSLSSSLLSLFDNLPWISAMDLAPEYDIADLLQIPLSASSVNENSITRGAGQRETSHNRISPPWTASVPRNGPDYTPSTPPPRIQHSRIMFRDLMPLFTYNDHRSPSSPVE